jgi:chromosome partitioning protein
MEIFSTQNEIISYLKTTKPTFQKYREFLPIFGMDSIPVKYYATDNILDFAISNLRKYHRLPDNMAFKDICGAVGADGFTEEAVYGKPSTEATVVAFNNLKGGVAKTTTTANIAAILASLGQRVLMVDMDMQNQLSDHFNNLDLPLGKDCYYEGKSILQIIELYNKEKEIDVDLLLETIVTIDAGNGKTIDLLPSEFELDRGLVAAKGGTRQFEFLLKKVLEPIMDRYDFILIDTPPVSSTLLDLSFFASDYITFVVTPDKKSFGSFKYLLKQIKKLEKEVKQFNLEVKSDSLILTRFKNPKNSDTSKAVGDELIYKCEAEGIKYYKFEEKELVSRADMDCQSLISFPERKEALAEIYNLIDYCISLINNKKDNK